MNYQILIKILLSATAFAVSTQLPAQTKSMEERLSALEARVEKLEGKTDEKKDTNNTKSEDSDGYKKGLLMHIWDMPSEFNGAIPDTRPIGAMNANTFPLSPGIIKNDKDFKKYYARPLFFLWDGYVKVKQSGTYTFIAEINVTDVKSTHNLYSGIYINGKPIVKLDRPSFIAGSQYNDPHSTSVSADIELSPGYHRISISLEGIHGRSKENYAALSVDLKVSEPKSRRPRSLTNEDLYHKD